MTKVLILGGYGNFGKRIADVLTRQNIPVIIAGRNDEKAQICLKSLPLGCAEKAIFDMKTDLQHQLDVLKPVVVINTCGPFQSGDLSVAQHCMRQGIHYIDLADGRDFVNDIIRWDAMAKNHDVAVIAGASTVPGLSSAVIEHLRPQFSVIDTLRYGIAPGQRAERGLATTQAILGYVGKRLKPCAGHDVRYGWQDLYIQHYPLLGRRWMANCDIPDLDMFPSAYGIRRIQFSAGMEHPLVHFGIWGLSWLVRFGLVQNLSRFASPLLKASTLFDRFGSSDGGMHVIVEGRDQSGAPLTKTWFVIALDGDGPYIPTIAAVVLAKKILNGQFSARGAMACIGLVTLEEYLEELKPFNITVIERDYP